MQPLPVVMGGMEERWLVERSGQDGPRPELERGSGDSRWRPGVHQAAWSRTSARLGLPGCLL